MRESNSINWLDSFSTAFSISKSPSPHFNQREEGQAISLIVLHNISLPPEKFAGHYIEDFFLGKLDASHHPYFETIQKLKVSSHLLIRRNGETIQFVGLQDRAWHAGRSTFLGSSDCNDFSIGIELEGSDNQPFTEAQYQQLIDICQLLLTHFPELSPQRIVGHSDIAADRKTDPGPFFQWRSFLKRLQMDSDAS